MKRIRDAAGKSALVTAALAVVLSACSALSPSTISEPYAASDGASLNLPGTSVALRNFLVIGAEKGSAAVVVGSVINGGPNQVQVSLQSDLGTTTQPTATVVTVGPNSSVQVGPDQKVSMEIAELPVEPGATTTFSAATVAGGKAELIVPVLRPEVEYSNLTPAPTTDEPTPTATKTKKPKADSTDEATPTDEPTAN